MNTILKSSRLLSLSATRLSTSLWCGFLQGSTSSRPSFQIRRNCFNFVTMKPTVYVTRNDYARIGLDLLKEECELTIWDEPSPVPREEFMKNVAGKDAIFCSLNDRIDKELLDQAGPSLKVIGTISVGFDHIDLKQCRERGIRVGYTPEVLTDATAELTIALLLATARRLLEANKEAHTGGWKSWSPMWMCGTSIKNSIQFCSRTDKCLTAEELGVSQIPFDELVETSDFIIVACSYNTETANMFNDSVFSRMRPSTILINTSRGGIIDQHDLIHALKAGKIRAAGLDVTTPEPLPLDNPLLHMSNVVVLPHIGSADVETRTEMSRITACNIISGLKGVKMISEI
ncbi:glyoxylate reductase/hydroxypyruvate reductase [Culex quinquefasciatus]|uniref:Glyoxylate reductase/hydroxypyruvate reductase n=1 Tax=Culex quinquefasciatus TaxID=7176 RepID=B0W2G1_CULQU|nr:glyoxylate reductase/hydroxypyruvate reductase [Culex quinquefasciatus]|eukprot:XP_001842864.1 glyoxylate reductase/hydroxypyruvate reductase [Culex quinquefasciatus]